MSLEIREIGETIKIDLTHVIGIIKTKKATIKIEIGIEISEIGHEIEIGNMIEEATVMIREIEIMKVTTIEKNSKVEKAEAEIKGTMTIKILTIQGINLLTRAEEIKTEVIEMVKAKVIRVVTKIIRSHQNIQKVDKQW